MRNENGQFVPMTEDGAKAYWDYSNALAFLAEIRRELVFDEITIRQALLRVRFTREKERQKFIKSCFDVPDNGNGIKEINLQSLQQTIDGRDVYCYAFESWSFYKETKIPTKYDKDEYIKLEAIALKLFDEFIEELERTADGNSESMQSASAENSGSASPVVWNWSVADLGWIFQTLHAKGAIKCGPSAFAALFIQKDGNMMPRDLNSYTKGQAPKHDATKEACALIGRHKPSE